MKSNKTTYLLFLIGICLVTACDHGGSDSSSGSGVVITIQGDNVLPITVDGSLCTGSAYINQPCVSVKVCSPNSSGTANCQVINDILLDTGDVGLRVFKSVFNSALLNSLGQVAATNGDSIAECVQYADGSLNWGTVMTADVVLAKESAVTVPIQVIDATYPGAPTICQNPNQDPNQSGFNGSLGVGLWLQDCGSACANNSFNGQYYACNSPTCSQSSVSLTDQVQNPVALLPIDNNGVMVVLPGIPFIGAVYANGALILGIDTQSNNIPSGLTAYDVDLTGEFTTVLDNVTYDSSFIDTGSNGFFFPPPSGNQLFDCTGQYSGWFCPPNTKNLTATVTAASGSPSGPVNFQIANFVQVFNATNNSAVFGNIGGPIPGQFDWGLPFFFGRTVVIGIEGQFSGSLGATGPYYAF